MSSVDGTIADDSHDEANVMVRSAPVTFVGVQLEELGARDVWTSFQDSVGLVHNGRGVRVRGWVRDGGGELGPGTANGGTADPGAEFVRILDGGERVDEETKVLRVEDAGCVLGDMVDGVRGARGRDTWGTLGHVETRNGGYR